MPSENDDLYFLDAGQSERGGHNYGLADTCLQLYANHQLARGKLTTSDEDYLQRVRDAIDADMGPPLIRGCMLHAGMGHHYEAIRREQQGIDSPLASVEEAVVHSADEFVEGKEHIDIVMETMTAYIESRGNEARRYKVLAVEQELRAYVKVDGRKELITIRIDLVLQDRQRRTMVIDHKGRMWGNPKTVRGYANGMQTLLLERFGRKEWPDTFYGVYLNLCEWPHHTKKKQGRPKFVRELVPSRPAALDAVSDTLRYIAQQQHALVEAGTDPRRYPKSFGDNGTCEHRYGPCPFVDICNHG